MDEVLTRKDEELAQLGGEITTLQAEAVHVQEGETAFAANPGANPVLVLPRSRANTRHLKLPSCWLRQSGSRSLLPKDMRRCR